VTVNAGSKSFHEWTDKWTFRERERERERERRVVDYAGVDEIIISTMFGNASQLDI
jgi:hypothetical protein